MDYRRNKIYVIVEGHGEAGNKGTPSPIINLVSRILIEREVWWLVAKSTWKMDSQGDFFTPNKLESILRIYKERDDCAAVIILVDMDEFCAKEKAHQIVLRIHDMEVLPFSVAVVCPKPEFEAWFLACLENIHPGHGFDDDPEEGRDAKGYLRREFDYKPTQNQLEYTNRLNIHRAGERSRSFRRLLHAIEELVEAKEQGNIIITPIIDD